MEFLLQGENIHSEKELGREVKLGTVSHCMQYNPVKKITGYQKGFLEQSLKNGLPQTVGGAGS